MGGLCLSAHRLDGRRRGRRAARFRREGARDVRIIAGRPRRRGGGRPAEAICPAVRSVRGDRLDPRRRKGGAGGLRPSRRPVGRTAQRVEICAILTGAPFRHDRNIGGKARGPGARKVRRLGPSGFSTVTQSLTQKSGAPVRGGASREGIAANWPRARAFRTRRSRRETRSRPGKSGHGLSGQSQALRLSGRGASLRRRDSAGGRAFAQGPGRRPARARRGGITRLRAAAGSPAAGGIS